MLRITHPTAGYNGSATVAGIALQFTGGTALLTSLDPRVPTQILSAGYGVTDDGSGISLTPNPGYVLSIAGLSGAVTLAQLQAAGVGTGGGGSTSTAGYTIVAATAGAYPATRPASAGAVWFSTPSVTPPSWALDGDIWAAA